MCSAQRTYVPQVSTMVHGTYLHLPKLGCLDAALCNRRVGGLQGDPTMTHDSDIAARGLLSLPTVTGRGWSLERGIEVNRRDMLYSG